MRLLWLLPLLLVGCASYNDIGNGRFDVTKTTEVRSPFGTNMGFARVENCEGVKEHPQDISIQFVDCHPMTDWVPMSSQGQGGIIASGLLQAGGLVGLGALMPHQGGATSSSSAVQSQSLSVAPAKGGHH